MKKTLLSLLLTLFLIGVFWVVPNGVVQNTPSNANAERDAAGDQPDDPGPLAKLSPKLNRAVILHAMKKVADWQLKQAEGKYNIEWTYAALYDGMLAASKATGDGRYHDRVLEVARENHWSLGPRPEHADDHAIGLTYLAFYAEKQDSERLAPTRDGMDKLLARDNRFLTMHEANGQRVFWSRGNGWVLAGLAMVLERMPATFPERVMYVQQYRDMAERIAGLQQADGLWRASLLDPGSYPNPEISGSAFYTYAMAWGIHHGVLDRKKYLPVVTRAWQGMLGHVYESGRLGSIQPIGGEPGKFKSSSSFVYGVGAFLLAGSELSELSQEK